MKVVFAHDHKFYYKSPTEFYTAGKLPYSIWERYLAFFDEIVIIARTQKFDESKSIVQSSGKNVSLVQITDLNNPKIRIQNFRKTQNIINETLKDADALIARLPSEIGNLAIKNAFKLNVPWATEVVGCAWDAVFNYGTIIGKFYAPIIYLKTKHLVKKSKFTLYVSNSFLQKRYPSKGYNCGCSDVELNDFSNEVLKKKQSSFNSGTKMFQIGLIGAVDSKIKGIDTALKAMQILKGHKVNVQLEIVGDGDKSIWTQKLQAMGIDENVNFKGTLKSGREVFSWLDSCNIYIQPSRQEGLPRALIEAMSRGCPCIGSNVGGVYELLDKAYLHNKNDYRKLASLILGFIKNKDLSLQQAIRNFKFSKNYIKPVLDKKRNDFWQAFVYYCKQQNNEIT